MQGGSRVSRTGRLLSESIQERSKDCRPSVSQQHASSGAVGEADIGVGDVVSSDHRDASRGSTTTWRPPPSKGSGGVRYPFGLPSWRLVMEAVNRVDKRSTEPDCQVRYMVQVLGADKHMCQPLCVKRPTYRELDSTKK